MKWSRLSDFLKDDSEIPTDIAFEIVDDIGIELGTVRAHKLILAAHSVFFRKAFFGTGLTFKEGTTGTVIVKETTKEAFVTMIDFIYEKNIRLGGKTVEELFGILNISKRYQLDDLTLAIKNHFENFPFTLGQDNYNEYNILKAVANAEEFEQFPVERGALFTCAAKFLKKKMTSVNDVLSFFDDKASEHSDVAVKLMAKLKSLPCEHCEWTPCRHGKELRRGRYVDRVKPGQLVKTGPGWREKYQGLTCVVISEKEQGKKELQFLNPPMPADEDVPNPYIWDPWQEYSHSNVTFICNGTL